MRNVRKFYLQNAAGGRYPLNGETGVWLTDPEGLGYTMAANYADLKSGFFESVASDAEPQGAVAGTLIFAKPGPYARYKGFIDWLAAAGSLDMVYDPDGSGEYLKRVDVSYITKGELARVGWLAVPASFLGLSPWYRPQATELSMDAGGEDLSLRYQYRYDSGLIYGADATASLSGTVAAAGHLPASVLFTFFGQVVTPVISCTGAVSGRLYGSCRIETTINAGEQLVFSTLRLDSRVVKITAAGEKVDLLPYVDLSTDPFFHLPVTEPCIFSMSSDAAVSGAGSLDVYYYYRSV